MPILEVNDTIARLMWFWKERFFFTIHKFDGIHFKAIVIPSTASKFSANSTLFLDAWMNIPVRSLV